jgi:metallophosphoesterase superfamily enzyme
LLKVVPREAALIFKEGEECTILVSDLHLGLEKEMAAKGFRIPSYSTKIMDRLNSLAEKYGANRIVVLGDVKRSDEKVGITHGHSWPSQEVISCGRMVIGHSHFRYEMRDRFGARSKEAAWLFARYDIAELLRKAALPAGVKGEGELIVMPPFNNLVGGQAINAKGGFDFGPVLSSGAVDAKDTDIFLLDGTRV